MPSYYDPNNEFTPQVDMSLLGNRSPNLTFGQRFAQGAQGLLGDRDLALALLANSGWQQGPRRSFGSVLGQSMLQADQAKSQRADDAFKRQYMQAQMQALLNRPGASPNGQYQPGNYTTQSWAKFEKSNDPADLVRYEPPRQEYKPSFRNVTRTLPDGSTELGSFDTQTNQYQWTGIVTPPGKKAEADAAGKALGEATGGQSAKKPAQASMDYVLSQFEPMLDQTSQGMIMGPLGKVFDYTDRKRFDNLKEQLSTELRTVFRIPGEGTLSDREQAQYGMQLPDTSNPPEVNRAILRDIRERVKLRLETPVGDNQPFSIVTPQPPKKETAAERAKRLGL